MPGPLYDTVRVRTSEGFPLRADFAGALDFRGLGARKGIDFGVTVPELTAMRDRSINPHAADVHGSITTDRLIASAAKVMAIPDTTIRDPCDVHAPGTADERAALADKLIARRDDIARQIASITQPRPAS